MKKLYALFLFVFCINLSIHAQTYEILSSAGGELEEFKTLYDGEDLFGYLELHKLDKIDKQSNKYKFIILDKNFNKISTNEFVLTRVVNYQRLSQAVYNKGKVLLGFSEASGVFYKNQQYKLIDIKSASISASFTLQNSKLMPLEETILKDNLDNFYNEGGSAYPAKNKGFLLVDRSIKGSTSFMKSGVFIDLDANQKWILPLKNGESPDYFYEYDFLTNDENSIALNANYYKRKKYLHRKLLILNADNGAEQAFSPMEESDTYLSINSIKFINDELVTIGEYYKRQGDNPLPNVNYKLGVFKKTYHRNGGEIIFKKLVPFTQLSTFVPIDANGKISKEGTLDFKDFEIRPDGTHLLFGETYKSDFMSGGIKFTELFYLILDKDFNPTKMVSSEVNKSLFPKYRYGQSIHNNEGYASFFIDPDQEKKLVLNILVYNDATQTFKQEKVDLEKKDSNTWFFVAKNGYVGLIEYFKKEVRKSTGKQAELHLEKIYIE